MWLDKRPFGQLSGLARQFIVVSTIACAGFAAEAESPLSNNGVKTEPVHTEFVHAERHAHMPHGMKVLFRDFEKLPADPNGMDLQSILKNSRNDKDQSGEQLYRSIPDDQRTALLNTVQDMHRIRFSKDRSSLFEHVIEFREFYQNGFSCKVDASFAALAAADPFMHYGNKLDKKIHPAPLGYVLVGNHKTHEIVPLHFTVYTNGAEFLVKFHNDETRDGLQHMIKFGLHLLMGTETNPYEMGKRLEQKVGIKPLYEVVPVL